MNQPVCKLQHTTRKREFNTQERKLHLPPTKLYETRFITRPNYRFKRGKLRFITFSTIEHVECIGRPHIHYSIKRLYELRRDSEVYEFLNNNRQLADVIIEAHSKIRKYFPSEKLILEVIIDHEDGSSQLVIFIQTDMSPQEAAEKLNKLDKDWWLNISIRDVVSGKLCITLEFR